MLSFYERAMILMKLIAWLLSWLMQLHRQWFASRINYFKQTILFTDSGVMSPHLFLLVHWLSVLPAISLRHQDNRTMLCYHYCATLIWIAFVEMYQVKTVRKAITCFSTHLLSAQSSGCTNHSLTLFSLSQASACPLPRAEVWLRPDVSLSQSLRTHSPSTPDVSVGQPVLLVAAWVCCPHVRLCVTA